jgi:2-polyprenyl-3-methyl-5-hydroxy-6-metoxy-1,4-benzoquinol methylase
MTREAIISPYIKGKSILDVGSVNEDGLHGFWRFLKSQASEVAGIDLRPSSEPGVVAGNMETYDFGRTFDAIVAGDVLIQTDNQGLFLDNCRKHLRPAGRLLITLPNAKWPTVFLRPSLFQTGWHDRHTLSQLLARHGLALEGLYYYYGNRHNWLWLRHLALFRQGMVAVCKIITEK